MLERLCSADDAGHQTQGQCDDDGVPALRFCRRRPLRIKEAGDAIL